MPNAECQTRSGTGLAAGPAQFFPGLQLRTQHGFPFIAHVLLEPSALLVEVEDFFRRRIFMEFTEMNALHFHELAHFEQSGKDPCSNTLDERFRMGHTTEADRQIIAERYQVNYPFLLYAGRISPHKNVGRIIEAFSALKAELEKEDKFPDLKLIIIGDELSRQSRISSSELATSACILPPVNSGKFTLPS